MDDTKIIFFTIFISAFLVMTYLVSSTGFMGLYIFTQREVEIYNDVNLSLREKTKIELTINKDGDFARTLYLYNPSTSGRTVSINWGIDSQEMLEYVNIRCTPQDYENLYLVPNEVKEVIIFIKVNGLPENTNPKITIYIGV